MNFSVGDRITAKGNISGYEGPGTILNVDTKDSRCGYLVSFDCNPGARIWSYTDSVKPLNTPNKILITSDGVTITATYTHDGKEDVGIVGAAQYKTFGRGAQAALQFAVGEFTKKRETPMDKPTYKAGDKVRIVEKGTHLFPIGTIVRLIEDGHWPKWKAEYLDGHDYWFVNESDISPYTEPSKPTEDKPDKVEPVKLYCTANGNGACHRISKGDICEFDEAGYFHFPDGTKSCSAYKSLDDFCKKNIAYADAGFIPLAKRPAKVGEWVYMVEYWGGPLDAGTIHKCTAPNELDGTFSCSKYTAYLVLSGYTPEPEQPKGWSGLAVCYCVSCGFTKGKRYAFVNGETVDDDGNTRPNPLSPIERILDTTDKWFADIFIPLID